MYLALDVSTKKIGVSILDSNENLIFTDVFMFNKSEKSLEKKGSVFRDYISTLYSNFPSIVGIFIEEPLFAGGPNSLTVSLLNCFNGMIRYIIYDIFKILPQLINVRKARGYFNIKIPKGSKGNQKKQIIINFVVDKYPNFRYNITRYGNASEGTDDIADSIVIALYGIRNNGKI